jgi:protein O-GlcNAc transferase
MYRRVLAADPRCFDALHLLGVLCTDAGAMDTGIELIRRALALDDSKANVHYSLAAALLRHGDAGSSLASIERAIALHPDFSEAWFLRGNILQHAGNFAQSAASYRRAVQLRPAFPEAFNNLAAVQRAQRALPDALASANQALALQPSYPNALNNRGLILLDCRQGSAAVDDFRRALSIEATFPEAWHNLGLALMHLRRFSEARDAFSRLAAIAPGFHHVAGDLLMAKLNACDWENYDVAVEALMQAIQDGKHVAVPLTLMCVSDCAALQLRCAELYSTAHFPAPASASAQDRKIRHSKNWIRVAYLSGDLGEHPITHLLAGVFERHDRSRFETIALSWDRRNEGATRRRVEAAFSRFIDITGAGDAQVAELMLELEVDIAVDLCGHTLGQRTGILARRAAPVQVNYLGLPATMGAPYVDYLIADRFLIPEDQWMHYSERIVWLPDSYQPNDDRRRLPAPSGSRAVFGLPEQGFIFCSFNRNTKMNPACFDIWMRLLQAVPGSVLWLLASSPAAEENLRREAAARGVHPGRLVFAGDVPYENYLARYAHADLFLDTWPFNGGATVSDALWMGLPVLTCAGETFSARMAGSLLAGLGFPELVTGSLTDYASAALKLAANLGELAAIRSRLTLLHSQHAFFDTDRYRLHLEAAYQTMWERNLSGLLPTAFSVARRH